MHSFGPPALHPLLPYLILIFLRNCSTHAGLFHSNVSMNSLLIMKNQPQTDSPVLPLESSQVLVPNSILTHHIAFWFIIVIITIKPVSPSLLPAPTLNFRVVILFHSKTKAPGPCTIPGKGKVLKKRVIDPKKFQSAHRETNILDPMHLALFCYLQEHKKFGASDMSLGSASPHITGPVSTEISLTSFYFPPVPHAWQFP